MKAKRLICATSLVASTMLANSAYAYEVFDQENFPDSSGSETITWTNDDIEWSTFSTTINELQQVPNPIHAPPPVIEADTCELLWPHEEMNLKVSFIREGRVKPYLHHFHVTNQNEFDITVRGADWAKAIVFQLNNVVLNWRHADSFEEAREEDRRVLYGYWYQEPFHSSSQVAETKPDVRFVDGKEAAVLVYEREDDDPAFLEEEIFNVPADPEGFVFEMIMDARKGAWADSHYRVDAELFCLDQTFDDATAESMASVVDTPEMPEAPEMPEELEAPEAPEAPDEPDEPLRPQGR